MPSQSLFASILEKKMNRRAIPLQISEVHTVDEMISPQFSQVFGSGGRSSKQRGFQVYGVA